jgi:two-component sensor histidine kinase
MRGDTLRPRHWARSLSTRLLLFLSIALLPLGVIAVFQTIQVIEETQRLAERDAVARTARAAEQHQALLERAFGAAAALGEAASQLADSPETCSSIMARFVAAEPDVVFAGFISADGMMSCNNSGETIDYADRPTWVAFVDNPVPDVNVSRSGDVSRQSVYIVLLPIFDGETGDLLGAQAISMPHSFAPLLFANDEQGLDLALIDSEGTILASSTGMDDLTAFERRNVVPGELDIPDDGLLIRADDNRRFDRPTAVVPLIEGQIYVLGLWTPGQMDNGVTALNLSVPLFPLLMWLASLAVAYFTVNNLLLKPLSLLSRQMLRYRADEPGEAFINLQDAPTEIMTIAESYNTLLDRVAEDTHRLQESVAEKETLLREVHHRVKNNLQLISSILNMQMRGVSDDTARRILSRVQDRVMSLSSVHRALYTETQLQSVRADLLLGEIISGIADLTTSTNNRVSVTVDLKPLRLDPDQAVPLSLLATEAMTNAVKYVGAADGERASIDVSLKEDEVRHVVFAIRNTRGPAASTDPDAEANGTGLGARLIRSFASQLGGDIEIDETETTYDLRVWFDRLNEA